jgi:hypothetical protein
VVLAALVGVMHGALFHLLFGQRLRHLAVAVAVGLIGGAVGGLVGTMIPPAVLMVGETNLIATTLAAWTGLGIARLFRFC